mmetsp:Transcript_14337/g.29371  ORF Transcript_14337/g.29371 Transcript_14337/m.29371 type:complete len:541 (-) Transcript_14337:818-2440(-)
MLSVNDICNSDHRDKEASDRHSARIDALLAQSQSPRTVGVLSRGECVSIVTPEAQSDSDRPSGTGGMRISSLINSPHIAPIKSPLGGEELERVQNEKPAALTEPQNDRSGERPKQKRYRAKPEQLRELLSMFEQNPSPPSDVLSELSNRIEMPLQSVILWFKNRRARVPHPTSTGSDVNRIVPSQMQSSSSIVLTQKKRRSNEETAVTSKRKPTRVEKEEAELILSAAVGNGSLAILQSSNSFDGSSSTTRFRQGDYSRYSPPRQSPRLQEKAAAAAAILASRMQDRFPPLSLSGFQLAPTSSMLAYQETTKRTKAPMSPRTQEQRDYKPGERVEVMENQRGFVRSWYSAKVIGPGLSRSPMPPSLNLPGTPRKSPRLAATPMPSSIQSNSRVRYRVEYEHLVQDTSTMEPLREDVSVLRLRPAPPSTMDWRPEVGDAVEALCDDAWFVGVIQSVARKAFAVAFEQGDSQWIRRMNLRPYRIWRGGNEWVKTKAPGTIMRRIGTPGGTWEERPGSQTSPRPSNQTGGDTQGIDSRRPRRR